MEQDAAPPGEQAGTTYQLLSSSQDQRWMLGQFRYCPSLKLGKDHAFRMYLEMPKSRGEEIEVPENGRPKRSFGVMARAEARDAPEPYWVLEDEDRPTAAWHGRKEGAMNSSYVFFAMQGDSFKVIPTGHVYNFRPKRTYKVPSVEEAEELMGNRRTNMRQWHARFKAMQQASEKEMKDEKNSSLGMNDLFGDDSDEDRFTKYKIRGDDRAMAAAARAKARARDAAEDDIDFDTRNEFDDDDHDMPDETAAPAPVSDLEDSDDDLLTKSGVELKSILRKAEAESRGESPEPEENDGDNSDEEDDDDDEVDLDELDNQYSVVFGGPKKNSGRSTPPPAASTTSTTTTTSSGAASALSSSRKRQLEGGADSGKAGKKARVDKAAVTITMEDVRQELLKHRRISSKDLISKFRPQIKANKKTLDFLLEATRQLAHIVEHPTGSGNRFLQIKDAYRRSKFRKKT